MDENGRNRQAADLEDADTVEGFDFPPPERKVITQSYDLSVKTLLEQWEDGVLVLPDIQREYVWDDGRASRLIESLILNIPVPVVYFAETDDAKYEIFDGHQRIRSIARYLRNEFSLRSLMVLSEYGGKRYHQLPEREQRFLSMRSLRAVIISVDSHPSMKFEIFERLNTGSIALNAQELRNSLYRGSLNDLLRRLVRDEAFRTLVGRPKPRSRMVDEELVLRFLALHDRYPTYRPPLKRFLNDFMGANRNPAPVRLARYEELFRRTVANVMHLFGGSAFRVADADGRPTESQVNRALYDAQMLASSHVLELPETPGRVLERMASLYQDGTFDDAIRRATGDRARLRLRVEAVARALGEAGVEARPPDLWG